MAMSPGEFATTDFSADDGRAITSLEVYEAFREAVNERLHVLRGWSQFKQWWESFGVTHTPQRPQPQAVPALTVFEAGGDPFVAFYVFSTPENQNSYISAWKAMQRRIDSMRMYFCEPGTLPPLPVGRAGHWPIPNQSGWTRKFPRQITSLSSPGEEGWRARFFHPQFFSHPNDNPAAREAHSFVHVFSFGAWVIDTDPLALPDMLVGLGPIESGDYIGLWILREMRDALLRMRLTYTSSHYRDAVDAIAVAQGRDMILRAHTAKTYRSVRAYQYGGTESWAQMESDYQLLSESLSLTETSTWVIGSSGVEEYTGLSHPYLNWPYVSHCSSQLGTDDWGNDPGHGADGVFQHVVPRNQPFSSLELGRFSRLGSHIAQPPIRFIVGRASAVLVSLYYVRRGLNCSTSVYMRGGGVNADVHDPMGSGINVGWNLVASGAPLDSTPPVVINGIARGATIGEIVLSFPSLGVNRSCLYQEVLVFRDYSIAGGFKYT
jgi:hypothetical protein